MSQTAQRFIHPPKLTLSYWIALCSGLIAYAVILDSLAFPLLIGTGAIALQCLAPSRLETAARSTFALASYLAALLPLWPGSHTDYWGLPLGLIATVSLIAALNKNSFGGSRAVTSMAAIAFLLLLRNIFLSFDFQAPIRELATSLAFVSVMDIALSKRYSNNGDSPHPELIFGLILSLAASFHFSSLPLAILLSTLPIVSYLLRIHDLTSNANEHTRDATPITPPELRKKPTPAGLIALPALFACLLYLLSLKIPFWAEYVPEHAPYYAVNMANKAHAVSEAAELEDEKIESIADTFVSRAFLEQKVTQLAKRISKSAPQAKAAETPTPPLPNPIESKGNNSQTPESGYGLNPFLRDESSRGIKIQQDDSQPEFTNHGWKRSSSVPLITPPRVALESGIPDDADLEIFSPEIAPPPPSTDVPNQTSAPLATSPSLFDQTEKSADFDRFLETFEQPEKAIAQSLNLEDNDVTALLSEEPLVIVKVDASRNAPQKLYLRSNVLDTISRDGFGGSRNENGRVPITTSNSQLVSTQSFHLSESEAATVTITAIQNRLPTLPLPESFSEIQIFDTDEISLYPEDRVAVAPLSEKPITYRLHKADLEITDRERKSSYLSQDYRSRMLEVPLSKRDRNYVTALAKRVGGSRSSSLQFAYRFANYFANRHEYSYFVDIPDGEGHPVVRWLKNECPGLCSNYAAAFTLLARSRGIPTRVVSGFTSNEFDPKEMRYVLRQNNAHAWVEFLNESNEWIRFDPTPGISEAEVQRTLDYVSAADPQSLPRLLQAEQNAAFQQNPAPPQATEPYGSNQPQSEPSAPAGSPPDLAGIAIPPPAPSSPVEKNSRPEKSASEPTSLDPPAAFEPVENTSSEPATPQIRPGQNETPPQTAGPETEVEQETANLPSSPPWVLLLVLLAFGVPALYFAFTRKRNRWGPPQLQLRHKAGRLLAELDSLIQQHELSNDPVWTQTRTTLAEQRYGREANPILVHDIAVKVGLLAKRKPGHTRNRTRKKK